MISAVRILSWDMGHRIVNHESKCANFHGHRYEAHFYAESDGLDSLGRVVDFSILKLKIGAWIDKFLDHTMMIYEKDPLLKTIKSCQTQKDFFITPFNPTAENIASFLFNEICPNLLKGKGIAIKKIRLYETPNCYVEVIKT